MATNEVQSAAPAGFGLRLAKGKAIRCYLTIPTGSSNPAQGTWGDFGYTPSSNPYWQNGGTTIAGSLFNKGTSSWYPASGYRINNSGALNDVATDGFSWSASPCDDAPNARGLYFISTGVLPVNGYSRSGGLPVRCVQE